MRRPDHNKPPTWFYHVAPNGLDTHRGTSDDCAACRRVKPAAPLLIVGKGLPWHEALRLILEGWRKCENCDATLGSRNATGYCAKCWPAKRAVIENTTWESIQ